MKLMTYNVYQGGKERFSLIKKLITQENPDVLAIQEACEWDSSGRTNLLREALGFPESGLAYFEANQRSLSGRRYDIVLMSRYPIKMVETINDSESIWHVLPYAEIASPTPIRVIPAHFSPKKEWRLKEVELVNDILEKSNEKPIVLMGDLNDLSPHDTYKADLFQRLQEHKIDKFGLPPDFSVIKQLEAAGWHDALLQQPNYDGKLHISVTEASDDKDHLNLRLDYVMVNTALLPKVRSVRVLASGENSEASDHFPVVAEIEQDA